VHRDRFASWTGNFRDDPLRVPRLDAQFTTTAAPSVARALAIPAPMVFDAAVTTPALVYI
jgi:hypothetical protein